MARLQAVQAPPAASEIIVAVAAHFDRATEDLVDGQSLERDIAIWIVRHWTDCSTRAVATALACDQATVVRADQRISEALVDDTVARARVHRAEDHVAQAFPMEDEDA